VNSHPLPYGDPRSQAAHQFLVEEAHLLDTLDFEGWLGLLDPGIRYRMPVRVTSARDTPETEVTTMDHFDEDWYSLAKRVERFGTDSAWTEDPPSRLRHHVSNVRTFADPAEEGALTVESAVLLYRSRGDRTEPSVLSAGRTDLLVPGPGGEGLRLRRRHIDIDEAVLRTQNLAIFL
jgi:phthalate 3,4-dioxygenase subunit beta